MKNIDWGLTCNILSALGTLAAAIFSAVSARASMLTVKALIEPKIERDEGFLRVPSNLIRKDAAGPYIPQYGRLNMTDAEYELLKKSKFKKVLVCAETTSSDAEETEWTVCSADPM